MVVTRAATKAYSQYKSLQAWDAFLEERVHFQLQACQSDPKKFKSSHMTPFKPLYPEMCPCQYKETHSFNSILDTKVDSILHIPPP